MLKPENRLAKVRDFNLLIKHGRYLGGRFLNLKWLRLAAVQDYFPKKENPDNFKIQLRLAVSVGSSLSKSAVKRNRVKRQMSEVVRLLVKGARLKSGYYLLFIAKPSVLGKNYAEISEEMKLLLSKAGVL